MRPTAKLDQRIWVRPILLARRQESLWVESLWVREILGHSVRVHRRDHHAPASRYDPTSIGPRRADATDTHMLRWMQTQCLLDHRIQIRCLLDSLESDRSVVVFGVDFLTHAREDV